MAGNQQLRNILKTINFGSLTAGNINDIGKNVFADLGAKTDITNLQEITDAWRAVTTPSYGQFIPQSGEFVTAAVEDTVTTLIAPTGNQVYECSYIGGLNGTFGSLTLTVTLSNLAGDVKVIMAEEVFTTGQEKAISFQNPIFVDSNAKLTVVASAATIDVTAYIHKVAN